MSQTAHPDTSTAIAQASQLNAFELFLEASRRYPARIALTDRERSFSYAETRTRVLALSEAFRTRGIRAGDRIAVLSQNCIEYIETHLAAARIGAIVACQNWRLQASELAHCVSLVEPALLLHSARFDAEAAELAARQQIPHCSWEALSDRGHDGREDVDKEDAASPESGLLILYTSGTTGPAKAAVISQRAIIARMMLLRIDLDIDDEDGFVAWAPMFHMGGSEHSVSTLMMGGTVFVADGFDEHYIAEIVGKQRLGWLLLVPATIERLLAAMDANGIEAASNASVPWRIYCRKNRSWNSARACAPPS